MCSTWISFLFAVTINFLRSKKLTCWLFVREQWLYLWEGTCSYTCMYMCMYMCVYFELYCTLYLSKTHTSVYLSIHVQGYVHIGSVPASPHGSTGYPTPQLKWACPSEERQCWIGSHGEAGWDDSMGGVSQWSSCWIKNLTSSLPGHHDLE